MGPNNKIILICIILLLIPIVLATDCFLDVCKTGEDFVILFKNATNESNAIYKSGATCLIKIDYPNGTNSITSVTMTDRGGGEYNYTITQPYNDTSPYSVYTNCTLGNAFIEQKGNLPIVSDRNIFLLQQNSKTINDTKDIANYINRSLQINMTKLTEMINGLNLSNQEKLNFILSNVTSISDYLNVTNQSHTQFLQNIISNSTYWFPQISSNQTYWFPILNSTLWQINATISNMIIPQLNNISANLTTILQKMNNIDLNMTTIINNTETIKLNVSQVIQDLKGQNTSVTNTLSTIQTNLTTVVNNVSSIINTGVNLNSAQNLTLYTILSDLSIVNITLEEVQASVALIPTTTSGGSTSKVIMTTEDTTCEKLYRARTTCLYWDGISCVEGCYTGYSCDADLVCTKSVFTPYEKNWFDVKRTINDLTKDYIHLSNENLNNKYLTVNYFVKPIWILPIIMVLIIGIILVIYTTKKKYDFEYES